MRVDTKAGNLIRQDNLCMQFSHLNNENLKGEAVERKFRFNEYGNPTYLKYR